MYTIQLLDKVFVTLSIETEAMFLHPRIPKIFTKLSSEKFLELISISSDGAGYFSNT
jgi:hypothetical protein